MKYNLLHNASKNRPQCSKVLKRDANHSSLTLFATAAVSAGYGPPMSKENSFFVVPTNHSVVRPILLTLKDCTKYYKRC